MLIKILEFIKHQNSQLKERIEIIDIAWYDTCLRKEYIIIEVRDSNISI